MEASIAYMLIFASNCFLLVSAKIAQDCCEKVYLFASVNYGESQSGLMGIYTYDGENLDRPYFSKKLNIDGIEMALYLTYTDNFTYPDEGWKVAGYPNGTELYIDISSSEEFSFCPIGLTGASYANTFGYSQFDETFLIECHSDEVKETCNHCDTLEVKSTLKNHTLFETFHLNGTFNGHPLYCSEKFGNFTYLYYKKDGVLDDGWAIGSPTQTLRFSPIILTQTRDPCPQTVEGGFIYQEVTYLFDETMTITCLKKDSGEGAEEEKIVEREMQMMGPSNASAPTAFFSLVLSFFICLVIMPAL